MDIDNYVFIQLFFIEIEEEVLVLSKKIIASFCMFLVALSIGSCGKNEKIDDTTEKNQEPVVLTWYYTWGSRSLKPDGMFLRAGT